MNKPADPTNRGLQCRQCLHIWEPSFAPNAEYGVKNHANVDDCDRSLDTRLAASEKKVEDATKLVPGKAAGPAREKLEKELKAAKVNLSMLTAEGSSLDRATRGLHTQRVEQSIESLSSRIASLP